MFCRLIPRPSPEYPAASGRGAALFGRRAWLLAAALCAAALCAAAPAYGQRASVAGRIVAAEDGRPMLGASVEVRDEEGAARRTLADAAGAFRLEGLAPGRYALTASSVGYAPHADTLVLGFGDTLRLHLRLERATTALEGVTVTEDRAPPPEAGRIHIRAADLARVPMPGITPDLAGLLTTLPGVVTTSDRGGQLFVRGGSAAENLVLVDGMPLYQPFHIVGFYSAFPADIVAYADLYAGGFAARYGGRVSSVLDVAARSGDKRQVRASASLAPFLGSVSLEGPLAPGKVSVLLHARESVVERLAPGLLGASLPFRFGDRFAKVHAFLNQTSSFSATALRTHDSGRIEGAGGGARRVGWRNEAYGGRYTYLPAEFPVMAQIAAYATRFRSDDRAGETRRTAEVSGNQGEIDFTYLLGPHQLHFGLFGRTNGFLNDFGDRNTALDENVSEGGGYVEGVWAPGRRWRVEPGLRAHAYSNGIRTGIEPRLRLRYSPGGRLAGHAFTAAGGVYHQQITGLHDQQEVTDVFIAWRPVRQNRAVPRAVHAIVGWQHRPTPWLSVTAEAYYKRLRRHTFVRFDEAARAFNIADDLAGSARGLDVRAEHIGPRLYAYLGYGLSRVAYRAPGAAAFSPPHDRRHQLHALAQWERGRLQASARWQFGSGRPFTQIVGFYNRLPRAAPWAETPGAAGEPTPAWAAPYAARLPAYHRLDLSAAYRLRAGLADVRLQLGLVNAYDQDNLFDYDFLTGRRTNQLPLLPTAGLRVDLNPRR